MTIHFYMEVRSEQNIQHVIRFCQRFLVEKFYVTLDSDAVGDLVRDALRSVDPGLSLEEANKAIIVKVKERVLAHSQSQGHGGPHGQGQGQGPSGPSQMAMDPVPPPQMAKMSKHDLNDEDDFYKRLQDLEAQRSLPQVNLGVGGGGGSGSVPNPVIQPSAPVVPPIGGPSVVYLPASATPNRYHKSIIINGSDRMWEYFTKRSTLVWSGSGASGVSTQLVALLLPKLCAELTPVVSVEITGATGNSMDIVCILRDRGHGPTWDTWVPCGDAALKTLACPWTIKLRNNFLRPLDFGEDALVIKQSMQLYNGNTKIILETRDRDKALCKGMKLLIRPAVGGGADDAREFETTVLNYDETSYAIEVPRITEGTTTSINLENAKVCNLHMQATLVLSVASPSERSE